MRKRRFKNTDLSPGQTSLDFKFVDSPKSKNMLDSALNTVLPREEILKLLSRKEEKSKANEEKKN